MKITACLLSKGDESTADASKSLEFPHVHVPNLARVAITWLAVFASTAVGGRLISAWTGPKAFAFTQCKAIQAGLVTAWRDFALAAGWCFHDIGTWFVFLRTATLAAAGLGDLWSTAIILEIDLLSLALACLFSL